VSAASGVTNVDPRVGPQRAQLPVIKHLCQGYFCQHRAMNSDAIKVFNRCFSVCMNCAMSQHQAYAVSPANATDERDPDEPGAIERRALPLRQSEYIKREHRTPPCQPWDPTLPARGIPN